MAGDALGFDLSTMLPADLRERAERNRTESAPANGSPPSLSHPGSPTARPSLTEPGSPPPAPSVTQPAAPPAAGHAPEPPPSEHVLRLATDVRALTYALAYVQAQLTETIEERNHAADVSRAAQTELDNARAQMQRLAEEVAQLRQSLGSAYRQTEQWSEHARSAHQRCADLEAELAQVRSWLPTGNIAAVPAE